MQRLLAQKSSDASLLRDYIRNYASRVLFRSKRWKLHPRNNSHGRAGLSSTQRDPSCSQAEGSRHRARPSVEEFLIFCIRRIVVIILCTCQLRFIWAAFKGGGRCVWNGRKAHAANTISLL